MSDGNLPALLKTPTPLTRRRQVDPTLHVGQSCDALWDPLGSIWLPGKILELAGHLIRVLVIVPATGITIQDALQAMHLLESGDADTHATVPLCFSELWLSTSEVRHRLAFPSGVHSGVHASQLVVLWPLYVENAAVSPSKPSLLAEAALGRTAGAPPPTTTRGSALAHVHAASEPADPMHCPPRVDSRGSESLLAPLLAGSHRAAAGQSRGAHPRHSLHSSGMAAHLQHQELLAALRPGLAVDAQDQYGTFRPATVVQVVHHHEAEAGDYIGRGGGPNLPAVHAVDVVFLDDGSAARVPMTWSPKPGDGGVGADVAGRVALPHWPWRVAPAGAVTAIALHDFEAGDFVDVALLVTSPASRRVTTQWRWGEVVQTRPTHVLIRYCEPLTEASQAPQGAHVTGQAVPTVGNRAALPSPLTCTPCVRDGAALGPADARPRHSSADEATGILRPGAVAREAPPYGSSGAGAGSGSGTPGGFRAGDSAGSDGSHSDGHWLEGARRSIDGAAVAPAAHHDGARPPPEEWIDLTSQSWRLREHGTMTDVSSAEELAAAEETRAFTAALASEGFERFVVRADGACLFRAVAHQIYGDQALHGRVRAAVCDYMAAHPSFFEALSSAFGQGLSEYLARMRQPGEWGGYVEIVAIEGEPSVLQLRALAATYFVPVLQPLTPTPLLALLPGH